MCGRQRGVTLRVFPLPVLHAKIIVAKKVGTRWGIFKIPIMIRRGEQITDALVMQTPVGIFLTRNGTFIVGVFTNTEVVLVVWIRKLALSIATFAFTSK